MSEKKKKKYLGISGERHDLRYGSGSDKVVAGIRIFGKGIFNAFRLLENEMPRMAETIERQKNNRK